MATKEYEGLTVETAINVIKQKHWKDLDAEDFAFLKARESYLSEADKEMYLSGKDPVEVMTDLGNALTREERIINENRPLQVEERRIRDAKDVAEAAVVAATQPLGTEARTEADEKEAENRAAHLESIEAEAKLAEKANKEAAKKAEADAKKSPAKTGATASVVVKGEEVK